MANVLTSLAADIYKAADMVGRELVGFIPSVTINAGSERVAKDGVIRSAFTRPQTVNTTFAPAMTIPEGTDQTVDNKTMTVDSYASVQIPYTGEDVRHLRNGAGFETVYGDQLVQAFRTVSNKIELSLWSAIYVASSRAYGTAGTTPFASTLSVLPQLRKILVDNGCPTKDGMLSVIMDTSAGANLRSLAQLQKANEAGGTELLRQGTLLDLQGFMLKESAQIGQHTKGAMTGADINNGSGEAVGQTTLTFDGGTVNSTGIKAGDVITLAGDSNKYVVTTGSTATGGDIVIAAPGLRIAAADATEITVGDSYTPNIGLHRSAVELAIRPPEVPVINGRQADQAIDKMIVQDPWSGLVFEIAVYAGYMKAMIEVRCLYGVKVWKPEFVATLLG